MNCNFIKAILVSLLLLVTQIVAADQYDTIRYHRNSIYTLLIEHPGCKFENQIKTEFLKISLSNKFNDHNLSVRSIIGSSNKDQTKDIQYFLSNADVAKRLVSKWFDRDKDSGSFDFALVAQRGYYDASVTDLNISNLSERGKSILADAGENLIGKTFIIVNDIRYIDKERQGQNIKTFLQLGASLAGSFSGANAYNTGNSLSGLLNMTSSLADLIAGFRVIVTSYLYRLNWNEENSNNFYKNYYFDRNCIDEKKKIDYENDHDLFKLELVGKYTSSSTKIVSRGVNSNEEVIRKVCARALDKNYAELSSTYEIFRIKSPILNVSSGYVTSPIGLKEGITKDSKFEVLEIIKDKVGKTIYRRVGIVKPVPDKIWDNQYMSIEEDAVNSNLEFTVFKIISGKNFYPGMLIREIK